MRVIALRANYQTITDITYKVERNMQVTMSVIRNNEVRNFEVYCNFTLRNLGFSEWVEVHEISRKKMKLKDIPRLLTNLSQNFAWVKSIAAKLNISPPPELTQVDLLSPKKKLPSQGGKKRTRFQFEQIFYTDEPKVDGRERNLTLPKGGNWRRISIH